ncbi:hypothetical protein GCM10022254_62430 [Actinomadura meridiana]|uniref:ATP-grasp domain-containing protein n=1 Tax=Actinomadura meridiana TaxID=559626 RepID=A0ABP8CIU6_9ACTN
MSGVITWIYEAETVDPGEIEEFEQSIVERYARLSRPRNLDFRLIRASELIALCTDRPVLRYRGDDLLADPQCFIVEDMGTDPHSSHAAQAVYRTIHASDSVLLNRSMSGPDYLERDKLAFAQVASTLDVPVLPTIAVPYGKYARRALDEVTNEFGAGPYIIKPREMTSGIGVLRVNSRQELGAAIDIASQTSAGYIVQPYLPHAGDMRVYVADGKVVASLTRRPGQGSYLASISQGGSIETNEDHFLVADHCMRIAQNLDAEWMCVDWLMTDEGPVLNEWCTANGGFTMVPEPQRTIVADAFFGWIKTKLDAALAEPSQRR